MEEHAVQKPRRIYEEMYFWLQALVAALTVLVLAFMFAGRVIAVEGSSMLPTLVEHDRLLLHNIAYTPKQGDVVVLTKDSFLETPIVKRVIATGGQTVEVSYEEGVVRVDGETLNEPYIREAMQKPYWDESAVVQVPEGFIFVMGDNRNHSSDSRDEKLGVVDERYVIGQALFVLFPLSHAGLVK